MMLAMRSSHPNFARDFRRVVRDRRESEGNVSRDVATILNEVRERGDEA